MLKGSLNFCFLGLFTLRTGCIVIATYFLIFSSVMFVAISSDETENLYYNLHGQQYITGIPMLVLSALGIIYSTNGLYGIFNERCKMVFPLISWGCILCLCTLKSFVDGLVHGTKDEEYPEAALEIGILITVALFTAMHSYFVFILSVYFRLPAVRR